MRARQKEKRPPRQLFSVRSIITGSVFLTHPNLAGRSNPGHLRLPLLIPPSKSTSPPRLVFHAVSNNFGSRTSLDPTHSPGVSHYHPTVQCVDLPHSQLALSRSDNAPLNATRLSAGRRNSTANCCRPIPRAHAPTRPSIPSSRGGKDHTWHLDPLSLPEGATPSLFSPLHSFYQPAVAQREKLGFPSSLFFVHRTKHSRYLRGRGTTCANGGAGKPNSNSNTLLFQIPPKTH